MMTWQPSIGQLVSARIVATWLGVQTLFHQCVVKCKESFLQCCLRCTIGLDQLLFY